MTQDQQKRISKRLSLHLRHEPGGLGLVLEEGGWVAVDQLLAASSKVHFAISRDELEYVVTNNDKQRFAFDESGKKIRASQGHSIEIDLQLEPQIPPEILYHGTAQKSIQSVLQTGLKPMSRHAVHLSVDKQTAMQVGARHGAPVMLKILAGDMARAGHWFYCSANGVWLVDAVPVKWLVLD